MCDTHLNVNFSMDQYFVTYYLFTARIEEINEAARARTEILEGRYINLVVLIKK